MKKKLLSLALALAVCLGLTPFALAENGSVYTYQTGEYAITNMYSIDDEWDGFGPGCPASGIAPMKITARKNLYAISVSIPVLDDEGTLIDERDFGEIDAPKPGDTLTLSEPGDYFISIGWDEKQLGGSGWAAIAVTVYDSVDSLQRVGTGGTPSADSGFTIYDGLLYSYEGTASKVVIPDSVTEIIAGAFDECDFLEEVTIPSSVTKIGGACFYNCKNLTAVNMPGGLTDIGTYSFWGTPWLKNLGDFAAVNGVLLAYQGSSKNVTVPDNVISVGNAAFSGCGLNSVALSKNTRHIGSGAFADCKNLTSVTIPAGVASIGLEAFAGCRSLKDVYYGGTESQWAAIQIDDTRNGNHLLKNAAIHYNFSSETSDGLAFSDVKATDYFADAVQWAVEKKITSGTSRTTFSPGATCSRAQILAFLWRASGSPEPTTANPFADIKTTDYYYKAALWAAEKGMVSGSGFGASTPCTRASTMEYMWKAAGSPAASYNGKFDDVSAGADYAQAVAWAVENNVTAGTSTTTFGPDSTCTRGQIVTFLYRAFAK